MATLGSTAATYAEWAKRVDPDGMISQIVEILKTTNEIMEDAAVVEGNLPTGHQSTIRTGLPTVAWRMLNQGVQPSKSTTVKQTDQCGMLEAYAEVDKSLADLNGNAAAWRLSEDSAFLEAMTQTMASTVFYGNTDTDPTKFLGLAPRYSSLSAATGANVISAGGSGSDNTSLWLVTWGDQYTHMIFPKGQRAGFQMLDKGQETLTDANGGKFEGYRTHYKWDVGMALRDWRYTVRLANIDVSDLLAGTTDLLKLMVRAMGRVQKLGVGRQAWYCNRTVWTELSVLAQNKANNQITTSELEGGGMLMRFKGIPVRMCDALLNTEAVVS